MEKEYREVEKTEVVQIPVYTFKASDLRSVEVDGFAATFDFGSEILEIEGTESELIAVKALIDAAAQRARGY